MKLIDQFRFVRQNMKKNKTRIFMTVLATAMGCAFLIVLASVGFGLHKSVIKDMTEQRMVTQIDVYGKESEKGYNNLTDQDIKQFEKLENVKAVTRRQQLRQPAMYEIDGYSTDASTLVAHMPSEVKAGLELSEGRLPNGNDEIVVGYHFLKSLVSVDAEGKEIYDEKGEIKEEYQYKESLIGKQLDLTVMQFIDGKEQKKTIPLTVVGVGKEPTREWVYDKNVFISEEILTQIEAFTGTAKGEITFPEENNLDDDVEMSVGKYYDEVKIYATNLEAVKGITEQLEEEQYAVYSVVSEVKQVNMLFTIAKIGLIFIGTIAIIIASIGIYNTMTMAVTERAPDIGIMKAIGANPTTIKRIFLIESCCIGLLGAIFGTIVSYAVSYGVNFSIPLVIQQAFGEELPEGLMFSSIPWNLPLICIAICLGVTILSGMRPAGRATKVDVLKAMRREV